MITKEEINAALGLSRTRLAELLYEHEGFVDMERGDGAPDREVPSWIDDNLNAKHDGDCTKQCHSCLACHARWALETWDEFAAMVVRAQSPNLQPPCISRGGGE